MTDDPTIIDLAKLAVSFNNAAKKRIDANPGLRSAVKNAITDRERRAMTTLMTKLMQSSIQADGSDGEIGKKLTEEQARKALKLCEISAGILNRVLSDENLFACVPPASLGDAKISPSFQRNGAPHLARLFAGPR